MRYAHTCQGAGGALEGANCERIFRERASDGRWLDRLSRSLKDLLHLLERIEDKGTGVRSHSEGVDTTTAAGRMLMQMVDTFAEL